MPRSRPILACDLPNFFDFSPDDHDLRCISLAPSLNRRCRIGVGWSYAAIKLRERILLDPNDEDLRVYITMCCCNRNYATQPSHRAKVSEPNLLSQVVERYKRELADRRASTLVHLPGTENSTPTAHTSSEVGSSIIRHRDPAPGNTAPVARQENVTSSTQVSQTQVSPDTPDTPIAPITEAISASIAVTRITRSATSQFPQIRVPTTPTTHAFLPYTTEIQPSVLTTILSRLTTMQQRPGWIYAFTRPTDPDQLKIGGSTTSVLRRLADFQFCSGPHNPVSCTYQIPTLHAFRVERLIQLELSAWRRRESRCRNFPHCVKLHREWFDGDKQGIRRVMFRWARWVGEARPYDEHGMLKNVWRRRCLEKAAEGVEITSEVLLGMIEAGDVVPHEEPGERDGDGAEEEEEGCPICLDEVLDLAVTVCGHRFCGGCIARVFEDRQARCPMCRANLVEASSSA